MIIIIVIIIIIIIIIIITIIIIIIIITMEVFLKPVKLKFSFDTKFNLCIRQFSKHKALKITVIPRKIISNYSLLYSFTRCY